MADERVMGTAVFIILIALAIVYVYINRASPGSPVTTTVQSGSTNTAITNNSGTKIVVYKNQSSTNSTSNTIVKNSTTTMSAINYVPILIRNSAGTALPAGFQEMLVVDSKNYSGQISSSWNNVEFTTVPQGGGAHVFAWVESNASSSSNATIVWVKLPYAITPHNSITIYMDFMPFAVMSKYGPTGEAPELGRNYGAYDNGGEVFNFYDNFSGTKLNTNLWINSSQFASNPIIVRDGLTIGEATSKQNNGYSAVLSLRSFGMGVVDFYGTLRNNSTQPHYQDVGLVPASSNNACNLIDIGSFVGPGYGGLQVINSYCTATYAQGLRFGSPQTYSIMVPSLNPNNVTAMVNYSDPISLSFSAITLPQNIGFENQGSGGNLGPIYWIRQRDYPYGGIMPQASFGRMQ